jgi:quinol monooxygenase YgiN
MDVVVVALKQNLDHSGYFDWDDKVANPCRDLTPSLANPQIDFWLAALHTARQRQPSGQIGGCVMRIVGGEEIYWIVKCAVQPGHLAEFKKVVGQLVAAAKEEPGTLAYEFSLDADQTAVHIFERYRDSNAVVSHVTQTFKPFGERFLALAKLSSFVVFGKPSEEAQAALAGLNPTYVTPFDGFTR